MHGYNTKFEWNKLVRLGSVVLDWMCNMKSILQVNLNWVLMYALKLMTKLFWVHLKPDGTRWCTGGEVKGKLANGVGSQYSHTTSERGVSSITNTDAHTSAASSWLNWHPRRFKWTCPFQRKTKSGFCACAIMFQMHSTTKLHGIKTITASFLFQPLLNISV